MQELTPQISRMPKEVPIVPIIRAKDSQVEWCSRSLKPISELPDFSMVKAYGVDTIIAGKGCEPHFHDCDEYWIIVEGRAKVILDDEETEVRAGDMVITPMGSEHQIIAIEETTVVWFEGELRGQKRPGHLH